MTSDRRTMFTIPEGDLTVTIFPGPSVISGPADAVAASNSLLAREPDGMLTEFVEISGGTA